MRHEVRQGTVGPKRTGFTYEVRQVQAFPETWQGKIEPIYAGYQPRNFCTLIALEIPASE